MLVTRLEVVEASFGIVVVASVAEGVSFCHFTGCRKDFTPSIVGVGCYSTRFEDPSAVREDLYQFDHIALQIQNIVEGSGACGGGAIVLQSIRLSAVIIDKV